MNIALDKSKEVRRSVFRNPIESDHYLYMSFNKQSSVIDNSDIFNLSSFTCFGQKRPSSEGFLYQQVRKLPLQCHNIQLEIIFYA
jgi:hypothetical protein